MNVYLCRWPNGDFSICTAESPRDAITDVVLDGVGDATVADCHVLNERVSVHLKLTDDGRFEFQDIDERNRDVLDRVYPHLLAYSDDAEEAVATSSDLDRIRAAVRLERGKASRSMRSRSKG